MADRFRFRDDRGLRASITRRQPAEETAVDAEPFISLDEQVQCVERELKQREWVYAKRIANGAMTKDFADLEKARMRAVLKTVTEARDAGRLI